MNEDLNQLIQRITHLELKMREHYHEGNEGTRINYFDIFGTPPVCVPARPATIATTGNTDDYIIAPISGILTSAEFSGVDALATSDTNYITFTITNLGQAGAGSAVMLSAVDGNTTKVTGGSALSANTKRSLILSTTPTVNQVTAGDRLRIRAAATGTLANTVTFPTYILRFV